MRSVSRIDVISLASTLISLAPSPISVNRFSGIVRRCGEYWGTLSALLTHLLLTHDGMHFSLHLLTAPAGPRVPFSLASLTRRHPSLPRKENLNPSRRRGAHPQRRERQKSPPIRRLGAQRRNKKPRSRPKNTRRPPFTRLRRKAKQFFPPTVAALRAKTTAH